MFELVLFPLSGNQSPVFKSCVENLGSIGCLPAARCQNSLSKYKSADILKQVISWNDFLLHTIQNSQLSFFVWPRKAQRVAFVGGAHRQCAQLPLDSCEPLWHRSHSHSHLGSRFPWLSLQKWHFSGMTTSDSISYYSAQNHWSRKSTCRLLTGLMDNIPNVASHARPIRDQSHSAGTCLWPGLEQVTFSSAGWHPIEEKFFSAPTPRKLHRKSVLPAWDLGSSLLFF